MLTHPHRQWLVILLCGLAAVAVSSPAVAQETSKSAPLAKELAQLMEQAKLTTIAARQPGKEDEYVAAMYFPGSELLVVSAKYAVPIYVDQKLEKKEYMEVYIDLNSASVAGSKVFVSDLQANGLVARPEEGQPFDTYEAAGKSYSFDRNWKKRDITEQDYMKQFEEADAAYAKMLTVLVTEFKKK